MKIIIDKYGFIIFAIITFLSFGVCLYKLCKETRETQRRDNLQLELELTEIEIRALEQQLEITELFKKILEEKMNEEKMNEEKMNEEVVVIVNPDGKQLQLGTKINN